MIKSKFLGSVIFALALLISTMSCANENAKTPQADKNGTMKSTAVAEKSIPLVGKTLEYNYGKNVYQVQFKTAKDLHWKCMKGDEKGKEADETYVTQKLNDYTYFVSWVEADGLGVSQVVNLKDNVVHCYLKIEKDIIPLSGSIRAL